MQKTGEVLIASPVRFCALDQSMKVTGQGCGESSPLRKGLP
jgi:hypothetical protein